MFSIAARIIDVLVVIAGGWMAYRLRWNAWVPAEEELLVLLLATAVTIIIFPVAGAYRQGKEAPGAGELGNALLGLFAVFVLLILLSATTKTTAEFSRLWMGYWGLITGFLLVFGRFALMRVSDAAIARGWNYRFIAIVGDGDLATHVAQSLRASPRAGYRVAGFISDTDSDARPADRFLGAIEDIDNLARTHSLQEIWIALPISAEGRLQEVLGALKNCLLTVRYVPDVFALRLLNHVPDRIANLITIELNGSPIRGANLVIKTGLDLLVATAALLVTSPLLLLTVVAIKLTSPGPVIYVQTRHGWDGKPIRIYKFRTMSQAASTSNEFIQATRNDPRITTIGRFLRRTSIDELPQFINVLQGRLSVVGPRPHPVALNDEFKDKVSTFMQRHRVKPGITGWAQINGFRGETDTLEKMRKRVEFDLYYIGNWSVWLDLKIIGLTVLGRFLDSSASQEHVSP
ncbi:MAG: undecaprenyl-phosphate glucose phosphotransferase [Pseudomonadota bacterium]